MQRIISLALRSTHQSRFMFSDVWKDRDEAAEKVYITKSESYAFS